jgi:hypothetical protein
MTRTVTPQAAQPSAAPKITHDRIAMRAYEKWMQRGCPHGTDQQDWLDAEAELKAELNRTASASAARPATPPRPAATPQPAPAPAAARRR